MDFLDQVNLTADVWVSEILFLFILIKRLVTSSFSLVVNLVCFRVTDIWTDRMAERASQGATELSIWNGNIFLAFQKAEWK
jgi:hypothetical protein